jgi:hypothetical protein
MHVGVAASLPRRSWRARLVIEAVLETLGILKLRRLSAAIPVAQALSVIPPRAGEEFSPYSLASTAPQVKPPPMASIRTRFPGFIRPSRTPASKASGIEAAEVLP